MEMIYVAGPIKGAPGDNMLHHVHTAIVAAKRLRDAGYCVIVPHRCALDELVLGEQSYEGWLEQDYELIRRSDFVYRLPGSSSGADREVAFAEDHGKGVFFDIEELLSLAERHCGSKHPANGHHRCPQPAGHSGLCGYATERWERDEA